MKDYLNLTDDETIADIAANIGVATTPPHLIAEFSDFVERHAGTLAACRIDALAAVTDMLARCPGEKRSTVLQMAAWELTNAAAIVANAMKQEAGEQLSPARFALVAYTRAACEIASGADRTVILDKVARLPTAEVDLTSDDAGAAYAEGLALLLDIAQASSPKR